MPSLLSISVLLTTLLIPFISPIQATKSPPQAIMSSKTSNTTIYFGYGSNLWLHQMALRCPHSEYLGVARLDNYKWIINDRGYANVVEVPATNDTKTEATNSSQYAHAVFGLVYSLTPPDERRLDKNEGVPIAYTKELISCKFWAAHHGKPVNVSAPPTETRDMLVYIDRERVEPSKPKAEYIVRMNHGIEDALTKGVPAEYVDKIMREFIPKEGGEGLEE
ncbi:hypothetical protein EJ04DRAFT_514418 [Polyplosphaeria fusca]|uniref:gamma-glutamylcyclotransferase n=1 Tax=Polyplosphaeria fusca TaxID=682080 RepID=A0A9P4UYR6_9PLEO|nr:hypothetical protein EJ04DRAFT_514418 [Polyplosphaeria fusca]